MCNKKLSQFFFQPVSNPLAYCLKRIQRLATYMDTWQFMDTLEVSNYIVVVLSFANFWYAKQMDKLFFSEKWRTGSKPALAIR
ncbi:MAG: hypothetical protein DRP66_04345 [Planctomycetota bacterium]|nr:MAG: hypothetical protein DRP66_04345 [Planctomycetota bacterium]